MLPGNGKPELTVTLDPLEIEPDPGEVLRYLGYPAGAEAAKRIEDRVHRAIEETRGRLHARGTYSLYPVTAKDRHSLTLAGRATFTGSIGDFLGGARRAAAFLATAGPEVVDLAEGALRQRDTLGGMVYNALGSHLADAASEGLIDHLRAQAGPDESLTLCYSPGYCGIALTQQLTLFTLLGAERIGVELLPAMIMKPVKSVSGLVGIGPREAVMAYGNPCDRCPAVDCRMRR